jgi:outer membrane protein OmpA-like peptidoglycan-associated protein
MYRLLIILILFPLCLFSQNNLKEEFEIDRLLSEGLYSDAEILLRNTFYADSTNKKLTYKYIQTLYKTKNHTELIEISKKYLKNSAGEENSIRIYFLLGESYKSTGNYNKALETFKQGYVLNQKIRLEEYNNRLKRSIESCNWAIKTINDTLKYKQLKIFDTLINQQTVNGHLWKDPYFIYSTNYIIDSITKDNIILAKDYTMKLKAYDIVNNVDIELKNIYTPSYHTTNGTFSDDNKQFYYSLCKNNTCKILVSNFNKGKWDIVDTLAGDINQNGASYTMPSLAKIGTKEYLFFCSDKKGGRGGLDIYMGELQNRKTINKTKNLIKINSPEDDITPYWDQQKSNLFFSSNWHNGFGGYDIFKSTFEKGNITTFENIGLPLNSSHNDLYYSNKDSIQIITSNRGKITNDCCNKVYLFVPIIEDDEKYINKIESDTLLTYENSTIRIKQKEKHLNYLKHIFPVSLYFHNDIPNPKNSDTITTVNYVDTYTDYLQLIETYQEEYSKGIKKQEKSNAEAEIDLFFNDYVVKGFNELNKLLEIIEIELNHGASFELTIKGYASPLAKTKYNEYLSKRRIHSIRNYLRTYNNGSLQKFLSDTNKVKLTFKEIPFGESNSNDYVSDNPNDKRNSIYSIHAALERKIEILSIEETDNEIVQHISVEKQHIELGNIKKNTASDVEFILENKNEHQIEIDKISNNCECIHYDKNTITLLPNEKKIFKLKIHTNKLKGNFEKSIYLKSKNSVSYLRLIISGNVE